MLEKIKNIEFLKYNKVAGLHCNVIDENSALFFLIIIRRKTGRIEIESHLEFQCDIDKVNSYISGSYPVYLSIEGKGIIHKQIIPDRSKGALQTAIPNANVNDFVFETFSGSSGEEYISFARKKYIDDILVRLLSQKVPVTGLTISPFSITGLLDIFPDLPGRIITGMYELEYDRGNHNILYFKKHVHTDSQCTYSINDIEVTSSFVLPFFNALTYYTNSESRINNSIVLNNLNEYNSKRIFQLAGSCILIFLFLILVINMFVFNSLTEEKQKLIQNTTADKELITRLNRLKEELLLKEKFLGRSGDDKNVLFSVFADQIGASLTDEITLEKLEIHPVISKVINKKAIDIQSNIIRIEGLSKSSSAVNDWTLILKKIKGVSDVIIVSFLQKDNYSPGTFTIEIMLQLTENE